MDILKAPRDFRGTPYAPGQKIVRPYLSGCSPFLEERTVLAVEGPNVIVTPSFGGSKAQVLRRAERACILN